MESIRVEPQQYAITGINDWQTLVLHNHQQARYWRRAKRISKWAIVAGIVFWIVRRR